MSADADTIPVLSGALGSWELSLARRPLGRSELAARYDDAAAGWERRIRRLGHPARCRALMQRVLAGLPAEGPVRALDCGTGTGAMALALAEAARVPVAVDAVDLSRAMLARAGARLRQAGVAAALQLADAEALPYPDGTFDLTMAGHIVEHLAHPDRAVAEMVRVTRPGGLVLVLATGRSPFGLFVHLLWRTHMLSPAHGLRLFRAAGLQDVRVLARRPGLLGAEGLALIGRRERCAALPAPTPARGA